GCVYMDFDRGLLETQGYGNYERLDPRLLPKLYVAYNTNLSKVSGKVHSDVKARFDRGEKKIVETMAEIASLAEQAREALLEGRVDDLHQLRIRDFDLRSSTFDIAQSNLDLIETARRIRASANFAGSGGTVIGTFRDDEML